MNPSRESQPLLIPLPTGDTLGSTLADRARSREEEYLFRQELERRRALEVKAELTKLQAEQEFQAAVREAQRQHHWMHCPKCGGELCEIDHGDLCIDRCETCEGVWLDAGELDQLLQREGDGLLGRFLRRLRG